MVASVALAPCSVPILDMKHGKRIGCFDESLNPKWDLFRHILAEASETLDHECSGRVCELQSRIFGWRPAYIWARAFLLALLLARWKAVRASTKGGDQVAASDVQSLGWTRSVGPAFCP